MLPMYAHLQVIRQLFPLSRKIIRTHNTQPVTACPHGGLTACCNMYRASVLSDFGDGLITPKGKAIRCGSVIARIQVPATLRPYKDKDHIPIVLFYAKGACGICASRCAVGAVTKSGHDKRVCVSQYGPTNAYAIKLGLPKEAYGCGFWSDRSPCESRIPV